jgi:hypothetical protein
MAPVEIFQYKIFKALSSLKLRVNPVTVSSKNAVLSFGMITFLIVLQGSGRIATNYFVLFFCTDS